MNHRYYALAATCALFKHAEFKLNTRFAAASLRIRYVPVEGTMMIDPDTARNLELVGNMAYKKSVHSLFGCVGSGVCFIYSLLIIGPRVLNHTYTAMAARLLRVNILSPITGD
jgi:DNA mismatch repair protein MSH4